MFNGVIVPRFIHFIKENMTHNETDTCFYIATIAVNETFTISFDAVFKDAATDLYDLNALYNAASILGHGNDTDLSNNNISVQLAFTVEKILNYTHPNYGDNLTYTIHVSNIGEGNATDFIVIDYLLKV